MQTLGTGTTILSLITYGLLTPSRPAYALDPFEIQVYDATANAPGSFGLELHANRSEETHFTLEPSYGLYPWWELGAYLQTAESNDGALHYAGAKLRSKFVIPVGLHGRLGVNLEAAWIPKTYDSARWTSEIRPMLAWENSLILVAFNPIIELSWTQPGRGQGPSFAPALMAKAKLFDLWAMGLEYYGDFGPIFVSESHRPVEQYIFAAADLIAFKSWELNVGLGEGLSSAHGKVVGKMILGYSFN